ncbi:hypothetical protein CHS0354_013443 [Potamilus streckersoni]|uniref:Uncharacterized protein n=1 Tax=Potamilus streckersoni TaxID=2493646 RepID=A0AAE0RYW3_9BIVA|nr:hypothetical protein CHS0354_013443 [Potamilus streckersoni]
MQLPSSSLCARKCESNKQAKVNCLGFNRFSVCKRRGATMAAEVIIGDNIATGDARGITSPHKPVDPTDIVSELKENPDKLPTALDTPPPTDADLENCVFKGSESSFPEPPAVITSRIRKIRFPKVLRFRRGQKHGRLVEESDVTPGDIQSEVHVEEPTKQARVSRIKNYGRRARNSLTNAGHILARSLPCTLVGCFQKCSGTRSREQLDGDSQQKAIDVPENMTSYVNENAEEVHNREEEITA